MQLFLNQTVQWSADNNMNLNPEKTKEMFLTLRHKSQNDLPALVIQNKEICNVEQTTILGLIVTENLTWSENTDYICKKASKRLHFLTELKRSGLSYSDLISYYTAVIRYVL